MAGSIETGFGAGQRSRRSVGRWSLVMVACLAAVLFLDWFSRSGGPRPATATPSVAAGQAASAERDHALLASTKRPAASRHRAFNAPELSESLRQAPDVTAEFDVRVTFGHRTRTDRKTVTRTKQRLHLAFVGSKEEWLFVQNPVDQRRMSGTLIEHGRRSLIEHDETELYNVGKGRGWADIVSLGVDAGALEALASTSRQSSAFGFAFVEFRPANAALGPVQELWWSKEAGLFSKLVAVDSGIRTELKLRGLRWEIDSSVLAEPSIRFPAYARIDVADFREQLHEHSPSASPSHQH